MLHEPGSPFLTKPRHHFPCLLSLLVATGLLLFAGLSTPVETIAPMGTVKPAAAYAHAHPRTR